MPIKNFFDWIKLKANLDKNIYQPPLVSEGDIWWASVGENIGSEINGKSQLFSRPVIIFKKLSHNFYFVIPTTTQNRKGTWFIHLRQQGKTMQGCLHQARSIDYRRLSSKLGRLDDNDFSNLKKAFTSLYI